MVPCVEAFQMLHSANIPQIPLGLHPQEADSCLPPLGLLIAPSLEKPAPKGTYTYT